MMLLLAFCVAIGLACANMSPIHFTVSRRGGNFPAPETANLTYLLEQFQIVESRFDATTRSFKGNKVVRKPKRVRGTQGSTLLLGEVGREGNWFVDLKLGEPEQRIDMDLDMLTADWWILSTSGKKGSMFWDFDSTTYVDSQAPLSLPTCRSPTDLVHLPMVKDPVPLTFAHCRAATQWIRTLLPSGAYLGLAPSASLSQTHSKSLIPQLLEKNIIDTQMWSILLVNSKDGIFTIGGTLAASVRQVEQETDDELARLSHDEYKRSEGPKKHELNTVDEWKWSRVSGADGWWQTLLRGIWVDKIKILHNQPIILDVNTPFIIAPPLAARAFYASISGSKKLDPPFDQFYEYPCFNPPKMQFEFPDWNVDIMKGKRGDGRWSPGGAFSLGRRAIGSGYCIGMVIESRWGVATDKMKEKGAGFQVESGNGLEDVWIIGEPFFRDVQVVFDPKEKRIGMQKI